MDNRGELDLPIVAAAMFVDETPAVVPEIGVLVTIDPETVLLLACLLLIASDAMADQDFAAGGDGEGEDVLEVFSSTDSSGSFLSTTGKTVA